jgi:hypothetical protein
VLLVSAVSIAAVATAADAANHDKLLSKSDAEQDRILAAIVSNAGFACPAVTRKMFLGSDGEGDGYFSVACSDGQEWMVRISSSGKGQTSAMPCATLEVLKVKCWQKM